MRWQLPAFCFPQDLSWNTLRSESARTLETALGGNAGLRELVLAYNGFSDIDGARIVKGLLKHGGQGSIRGYLPVQQAHSTHHPPPAWVPIALPSSSSFAPAAETP